MVSLSEINCRICFIECDPTANNASDISDLYFDITGYIIYSTDIPQKICQECMNELIKIQTFKKVCDSAEKFLVEKRLENDLHLDDIKTEVTDHVKEENPLQYVETLISDNDSLPSKTFPKSDFTSSKRKCLEFNWSYNDLENHFGKTGTNPSDMHKFILNFDNLPAVTLPENLDLQDYDEKNVQNNILNCTFCSFQVRGINAIIEMRKHCDSNSNNHNYFKCLFVSHKFIFPCLDLMRLHFKAFSSHHNELVLVRELKCDFCSFCCCFEENMKLHYTKMHANQILEECDKCNAKFYSKDLKFQHYVFQCICNATSGLTEVLKEPFKRIILPKSFMKSFPINLQDNDKILVRKPKRAVKEKDSLSEMDLQPYQCDICGQFLKNKRNLEGHIKNVHLNIKSIACQYCGETFKSHANRRYHLKNVHNKEFEHICSVCGKAFFTPSFLKYHEASHFENYTIPCTVPNCTKLCKTKIHLQKHIAHRHSNKTFTCDLCGKLFTNKANLRQHKTTHKPNTYFCPECPNTFSASHAMRKHVAEKHPTFEMPPVGTLLKNQKWNNPDEFYSK